MKKFRILVFLAFCFSLERGYAESTFNYDYIEVGAITLDSKILDRNGDTLIEMDGDTQDVSGSFDLTERVNLVASHQSTDFNFDIEGSQSTLGIGYHDGIGRGTDLYAQIFYLETELLFPEDIELRDVVDSGNGFNIGIRNLIRRRFEIDFAFSRINIGNIGDDQTGFSIAGRYYFHRTIALGVYYSSIAETYGSGVVIRIGF
jgi:hypothetical protein